MSTEPKPEGVYLASITHSGEINVRMAQIFFTQASLRPCMTRIQQSSLLAAACNDHWCAAINHREEYNLKWFVLLHSDIVPEQGFVDKLIALAEKHDADLVSAVVPIKEASGVSSTAVSGYDDFERLTRLTMAQIHDKSLPATFDIDDVIKSLPFNLSEHNEAKKLRLLVNTGCFVARIDRPWCMNVSFTINDRIISVRGTGKLISQVEPEDWYFSRRVAEEGGKVMATREVVVEHIGSVPYRNDKVWGEWWDSKGLLK